MNKDLVIGIMNYLIDNLGLTQVAAAGFVGNFYRESHLDPTAVNKYSGAAGIAQWIGPRKVSYLKEMGVSPEKSPLDDQLKYIVKEVNGAWKKALLANKAATPEYAADLVFGYYEFSAGFEEACKCYTKYNNQAATDDCVNKGRQYAREAYNLYTSC